MSPQMRSRFRASAQHRLRDSAGRLFDVYGLGVSLDQVAHDANTRLETAVRYYFDINGLLDPYVRELMARARGVWLSAGFTPPDGEPTAALVARMEAGLRSWFTLMQKECLNPESDHCRLARLIAQVPIEHPLRPLLKAFREQERSNIEIVCEIGIFSNGRDLADHLWLLLEGARNERRFLGYYSPANKLARLAHGLMDAHRLKDDVDEED